ARTRNSAGAITGASCRAELATKPNRPRMVVAQATSVVPEAQPQSGPFTSARVRAPIETASSSAPRTSGMRVTDGSREVGTHTAAAASAANPTGTLTMNTQRQDASTSTPPTAGPSAAATAPVAAQMRTDRCRCTGGVDATTSPRLAGVSNAAPAACTTRQTTSHHTPSLAAQAALAAVNTASPSRQPPLRPYRSAMRPAGTSSAA